MAHLASRQECDRVLAVAPQNAVAARVREAATAFAAAALKAPAADSSAMSLTPDLVVTWILCKKGFVKVTTPAGKLSVVTSVATLPQTDYQVDSVFLRGIPAICDNDLRLLQNLPGLKGCALGRTRITNEAFIHLSQLASLTWLELVGTHIDDVAIAELMRMTGLRS